MQLAKLVRLAPTVYSRVSDVSLQERGAQLAPVWGAELRERYVQCANDFRTIIRCARPEPIPQTRASVRTGTINLFERHDASDGLGSMMLAAWLRLDEYRPGSSAHEHVSMPEQHFCVTTHFLGILATGQSVEINSSQPEFFGGVAWGEAHVPAFVSNPSTLCTDVYARGEQVFYGDDHRWNPDLYARIACHMEDMLARAEDTQALLTQALCDEVLNPAFAPAARRLLLAA